MDLRAREGHGIPGGAVKCVEIRRNTKAKAVSWLVSDAEVRKLGERTGLDTPVVLAVNDDHQAWEGSTPSVPKLTQ